MTVKVLTVYTDGRNTVFLHISAAEPMNAQQVFEPQPRAASCRTDFSTGGPAPIQPGMPARTLSTVPYHAAGSRQRLTGSWWLPLRQMTRDRRYQND